MDSSKYLSELKTHCNKIKPFVSYYSKLISSYNTTVHNILVNEIQPLLPHGLITTLVSGFIGLAYEGIFSFLQKKCNDALQKAMITMNSEAEFQCNKLLKLDNTMLVYGIYNAEMLEKLINTVRELHNITSSHEKLFAGEYNPSLFRILYMNALGVQQYAFNSLLFLRIVQDKYISLYKELVTQLKSYISAIRVLAKGYLPTTLITPSKLQEILDTNKDAQSYTHLHVNKPYIALNSETYISLMQQELRSCKKIGDEFYCEELFVVKHKSIYSCESAIYFNLSTHII